MERRPRGGYGIAALATVLGFGPMLGGSPAWAQTAATSSIPLDTIDVSGKASETATGPVHGYVATESAAGTKTATPLIRTPQSISVVGAEQIEDQKAQSIEEAVRYSPGIVQNYGFDTRGDWFLIRGFDAHDIGYFLDGLQLYETSFAGWRLDPWALERIAIVEGPSSVLYGGGSPGGLVNAVSKMPTFTTFGVIEMGINQYGNAYGAVDIGGVAGKNKEWAYRFVSTGRVGGTQVNFTKDDRALIAPSLTYRPNGATSLTILGQYQRDWSNNPNFLPYEGTVTPAPFGRISTSLFTSEPSLDTYQREQAMIGYRFATTISPLLTLRQNFRYNHVDVLEDSLYGAGYAATPTATSAELARYNFATHPHADLIEVDNQAEFHFDSWTLKHTALFGIDYKHYFLHDDQGFALGSNLNVIAPAYTPATPVTSRYNDNDTTQDQTGLYGQDQIRFGRLTVAGALRQDFVETDTVSRSTGVGYNSTPLATTGKIGVIYDFDNGFAPYASYSTSFNPILGTNTATGLPYVPERGEQEEVGLKYQSPVMPVKGAIALFNLVRSNVLTTDPDNALNSVQSGQERSRGIELSATATLADGLKLIGAFTAYQIEVTQDLDSSLIGKVPTATPEQFGSLWLDYTLQSGPLKGFGFGAGVRYVGRSYADEDNTLAVPAYVLGDAAIHYEREHWRVVLNVTNIADKTFVSACDSATSCFYGDRRRVTASLTYKW